MSSKKYWKSEAELNPNDSIVETLRQNEFPEEIPVDEFLGDNEGLVIAEIELQDEKQVFLRPKWLGKEVIEPMLGNLKEALKKELDTWW